MCIFFGARLTYTPVFEGIDSSSLPSCYANDIPSVGRAVSLSMNASNLCYKKLNFSGTDGGRKYGAYICQMAANVCRFQVSQQIKYNFEHCEESYRPPSGDPTTTTTPPPPPSCSAGQYEVRPYPNLSCCPNGQKYKYCGRNVACYEPWWYVECMPRSGYCLMKNGYNKFPYTCYWP